MAVQINYRCPKCPPIEPGPTYGNLNSDTSEYSKMLYIPDSESQKIYEQFNIDPAEWSLGYKVQYANQKWTFSLLFKNNLDKTKNFRVHCGVI
jgi:hypothetical protein